MQSSTSLKTKVRSLLNNVIYQGRINKNSKCEEYIFQSHRSIIFKGFQKVFYDYIYRESIGGSTLLLLPEEGT
jgi:hypothetical protein